MKSISKYFLIIISLFIFQNIFAQTDGDAVFNKVIHEYTLNDDGSSEYREYKEIKLLSHMAFHRLYGETFVIYDPEYQELQINEAYTIMADGQRVEVPDNAFNEVLPRAAAHAAPYNRLREMVITHTGLEVGAIIYLDYTLKTTSGYMPAFMGEELIKDIVPVKEKMVIIHIPSALELQYKMLNLRTAPEVNDGKGIRTYTFTFNELSASTHEWGTDNELLPHLFFSTAKDLERAYFPFVGQGAFTFQASPDMKKAIEKIKRANEGELNQILAIQKMVVDEISTWSLPLEYTGFKCRTPEEVWQSNAGTALEKTVLLATLLLKADFRAVPVAIIPEKYYDGKVGSLYMFEDFAVQVKTGNGDALYLSATHGQTQDLAFKMSGKKRLILDGAIESLKTIEPGSIKNEIIYEGKLINDENEKIKGKLAIKLVGAVNPYFSLFIDTAYAKRYANGVQDVKINMLNTNESAFELDIVQLTALKQYDDYIFMDLPVCPTGISSWGFQYVERGRKAPIKLNELIDEKYHYSIEIAEGYVLVSPAVDITIDNEIGKLKISLRQAGNVVYTTREIMLKQDFIEYNDFAAFNELWNAWVNTSLQEIVLKKQ